MSLAERTVGGLHDFLVDSVLRRYTVKGGQALDLGAGSGALALRLQKLGMEVLAVDIERQRFRANIPFALIDLDAPDFGGSLGGNVFDLITAVEVIEHLESPISFLRNIEHLLTPDGTVVITTPNVDNAPARVKFLLTGKLRMMDERGDQTHISPIFLDLFTRQYLPRAGFNLKEHYLYPPKGYKVTRQRYAWAFSVLGRFLRGNALLGDNHIFVLQSL